MDLRLLLLSVCGGIALIAFLPHFPSSFWVTISLLLIVGSCWLAWRWDRREFLLLAGIAVGCSWGIYYGHRLHNALLPIQWEQKHITVAGYISSLPNEEHGDGLTRQRFIFRVNSSSPHLTIHRLYLNWYNSQRSVRVGEYWDFTVKLKRPHGLANPGGYDYHAWLLQRGIHARGTIQEGHYTRCCAWQGTIHQWRGALRDRIRQSIGHLEHHSLIIALAMGDRSAISPAQWGILQQTGISHLIAISGLHIGLVSLLGYFIIFNITRLLSPAHHSYPSQIYGLCGAVIAALAYSAIAGFSLPTQRALIMLAAISVGKLSRRKIRFDLSLSIALCGVLLHSPLAIRSVEFWLSFTATAVLIYSIHSHHHFLYKWLRAQLLVSTALVIPLMTFLHQVPLNTIACNFIAIPLISFFVLPGVLVASSIAWVTPTFATELLYGCHLLLDGLWRILQWVPTFMWIHPPVPVTILLWAALGITLLIVATGFPARYLGLFFCLPFLAPLPPTHHAQLEVVVLDVGQGLSVFIATPNHYFLYDTGAYFSETFDIGKSVIVPYLRYRGINHLDGMLLSHNDNDHIGGAQQVLQQIRTSHLWYSSPLPELSSLATHHDLCRQGLQWEWDGVLFHILHPSGYRWRQENNRSCVLLIETQDVRILLPGDIEAWGEYSLLAHHPHLQPVDILLAPHHGSVTSSSPSLIQKLRPRYVVYSAGYRNAFNHPHPIVRQRYHKSINLITADTGALSFIIDQHGVLLPPRAHRHQAWRYWWKWSHSEP